MAKLEAAKLYETSEYQQLLRMSISRNMSAFSTHGPNHFSEALPMKMNE